MVQLYTCRHMGEIYPEPGAGAFQMGGMLSAFIHFQGQRPLW